MFRELKPKFAVSAHAQWSVSSPGSCVLKPQAVPGLRGSRLGLLKNSSEEKCGACLLGCLLFSEALRLPRGPSETNGKPRKVLVSQPLSLWDLFSV